MLKNLEQGPNLKIETDSDLRGSLQDLSQQILSWPEKSALMPFARESLGIQPQYEDSWYRSACWGYYAARLLALFLRSNEEDKVFELLEPNCDWSAFDQAVSLGKGAVILTAHLGAGRIPAHVAAFRGNRVKHIARFRGEYSSEAREDPIFVSTDAEIKVSLIKGVKHLNSGGVIAAAPTGRYGGQHLMANFLGHPFPVFLGIGEIARISGAPAFWMTCSWTAPDRLRLIIEPIPTPVGEGEEWHKQFFGVYFDKLGRHMRQFPADLGFLRGCWGGETGLPWYQPQGVAL